MGRSVSTHRHAVETIYLHSVVPDDAESYEWDYFIEDIRSILSKRYPSLSECERWQDREDRIILENKRAEVSVSEYCGLVAVCLAPLDPYNQLDQGWCDRVSKSFRDTLHKAYPSSALHKLGRFSNGEGVFAPITRPEGVVTSKEGVLW
jgi:hypothetical protein